MSFIARIWIRELLGSVLNEEELNEEMKRINAMDEEEFSEYVKTLGSDPSKEDVHADICQMLHETYKAKNADYGDSFALVRGKYPNAILIRYAFVSEKTHISRIRHRRHHARLL